jgi:hypothetical protein
MNHKQSERIVYRLVQSGELEIDSDGRIWRVMKRTFDRWSSAIRVTPCRRARAEQTLPEGGLQVRAMIDGKRHYASASRMVWHHFNGPIPLGLNVRHEDGVKSRNLPANLSLATYSELRLHVSRVLGGRHHDVRGSKHPKTRLSEKQVATMRRLRASGVMVKTIAAKFGATPNAVSQICRGVTWKHVPNCAHGSKTG